MVSSRQTALAGADFDTWLQTRPVPWTPAQIEIVRSAYARSGEPELAVADLLADLGMDHEVVAAALLHELVAAGDLKPTAVQDEFGAGIARLTASITKLDAISELHQSAQHAGRQLESLRKMLLAMAQDVRVVLIKLTMRLHDLRRLGQRPAEEQRRMAKETLDIFSPLANRLGIGRIKWEMEDLALRYLDPVTYKQIATALDQRRTDREHYIDQLIAELRDHLQQVGLHTEVSGRVKHIYSIWRKMQRKKLSFEQIFDVRAVRVMVDSVSDCYAALGVAHTLWNHIHREFDDYIAHPKPNGYQSLHTAVIGPEGRAVEVQIRTFDMHQNAELGVAAHWRYKEGGGPGDATAQQIAWLRQMLEYREDDSDDGDLLERFKAEAFQDRVYAITPKGAIVELPQGATPLDFAYHVHTEVGHRCRGAKVNGRIVPLTYELKNGEQVDVLTAKSGGPSRDWLSPHLGYVKSNRARAKIRQWFIQQDQDKNIAAGRAALEKEFQRLGVRQIKLEKVAEKLHFAKPDELFATIGHGALTTAQVIARIPELISSAPMHGDSLPVTRKAKPVEPGKGGDMQIRGVGRLMTQMAHCCQPAPFEPIAGYITQGRGVTIHRQDCANLLGLASQHHERVIEVSWGETPATYPVDIMIIAYDRSGLLRDITSVLANDQVNVLGANTLTDRDTSIARMGLTLEITDVVQLSRVLDKISQLHNVVEAYRKT